MRIFSSPFRAESFRDNRSRNLRNQRNAIQSQAPSASRTFKMFMHGVKRVFNPIVHAPGDCMRSTFCRTERNSNTGLIDSNSIKPRRIFKPLILAGSAGLVGRAIYHANQQPSGQTFLESFKDAGNGLANDFEAAADWIGEAAGVVSEKVAKAGEAVISHIGDSIGAVTGFATIVPTALKFTHESIRHRHDLTRHRRILKDLRTANCNGGYVKQKTLRRLAKIKRISLERSRNDYQTYTLGVHRFGRPATSPNGRANAIDVYCNRQNNISIRIYDQDGHALKYSENPGNQRGVGKLPKSLALKIKAHAYNLSDRGHENLDPAQRNDQAIKRIILSELGLSDRDGKTLLSRVAQGPRFDAYKDKPNRLGMRYLKDLALSPINLASLLTHSAAKKVSPALGQDRNHLVKVSTRELQEHARFLHDQLDGTRTSFDAKKGAVLASGAGALALGPIGLLIGVPGAAVGRAEYERQSDNIEALKEECRALNPSIPD